jgi:hypothetical protein
MSVTPQRPQRQDTFDLRDQIISDDNHNLQAHADATVNYGDDEEHSMLEDDSEQEEDGEGDEFMDDGSSSLSIPNESIDFDMVYALHSFAATVEGQANVVKGDSLFLMDDSNSYWWLVRVLKTQEVGYIPAENIETPFERLARLNKHRNVDVSLNTFIIVAFIYFHQLAAPTEAESQESLSAARNRVRNNITFGNSADLNHSADSNGPYGRTNRRRSIHFNSVRSHHRYVPPLREGEIEDEDDEWDTEGFEDEDLDLAADQMYMQSMDEDEVIDAMEGDDGMQWDEDTIEDIHVQGRQVQGSSIPDVLQPGSVREQQEQQRLRALQQEQLLQREEQLIQDRQQQLQLQASQQLAAQQTTQAALQAQQQQQAPQQQQPTLRSQTSRERMAQDPAEVTETRKVTATPTIAREYDERPTGQPFLPSAIVEEERSKRLREDDSSSDDLTRKKSKGKEKMAAPVSSATYNKPQSAKLRKEPSRNEKADTDDEGKEKKKKSSVFGGLFGRGKKDKSKDKNSSVGSVESEYVGRGSEESSRSSQRPPDGSISPTTSAAQQQQQAVSLKNAAAEIRAASQVVQAAPVTPERSTTPQVSDHASQLRQRDQQQQALYQKYLNSSPSSPPEAQPSYGLQSASAVMLSSPSSNSALGPPVSRPRPGSLILTPSSSDTAQAATLNVIRVFAGKNLPTDSTFKTVLLNSSTTAADLLRQSIQRFRLPGGEDENDYYLTIKQVVGGNYTVLQPNENALVVFDILVNEAMELPQVKRSSVGSISSIASNLSMHPAIKKLSMNDFADDSAVKFYLNKKGDAGTDDSMTGHEGDDTLTADTSHGDIEGLVGFKSPFSTASTAGANFTPERFTSPSFRFAVQAVIYAEDLPDDMQFHPQTEAIVLKSSLADLNAPVVVSPNLRRKVFMLPKNITVAEVTEIGLERFGIQDGVVDGGDEVEDKMTKRRSVARVRYGLMVAVDGHGVLFFPFCGIMIFLDLCDA